MWDEGIVSQTIMLSAVEKGYGGCMIGSCKRVEILEAVELDPQRYSLALVLALGKPKEEVVWCRLARMAVQLITGMRIRCIMCRNGRWKIVLV